MSRAGRIFNSFLILFGVIVMLLAIGAMTQAVIELELNQLFGRRRVKSMIEKLQNHIILCGFGRMGRGAAEELRQSSVPFVVVDKNEERVEMAIKAGMLAVAVRRDEMTILKSSAAFLLCAAEAICFGQGSISGKILTAAGAGAAVPGAPVQATNLDTRETYKTTSASDGSIT